MSADSDGGNSFRMVDLESKQDPPGADAQVKKAKKAKQKSFKKKFKSILKEHYDDEKTWWDAVEDLLKKDGDFAEKVGRSSRSAFHRS